MQAKCNEPRDMMVLQYTVALCLHRHVIIIWFNGLFTELYCKTIIAFVTVPFCLEFYLISNLVLYQGNCYNIIRVN